MLPQIHLGFIVLPSYTLFVVMGLLAYTLVTILVFEKKEKLPKKTTNRMLILSVFGAFFLFIFAFLFNSLFHSIEKGKIVLGGITWFGGFLGLMFSMAFLIHFFMPDGKGNELHYLSLMIPGIVIGHAFGRIGCFLGGCCYGKVTDSIFGVVFPEGSLAASQYPAEDGSSLPVYPTQLFESAFEFLLFAALMILYKKCRGKNLQVYLIAYGIFRFALEFLRGDDRGETGLPVTPSQLMCLIGVILGVLLILFDKKIIFRRLYRKTEEWKHSPRVKARAIDYVAEIESLFSLYEKGVLTEEEYTTRKALILQRENKKITEEQNEQNT